MLTSAGALPVWGRVYKGPVVSAARVCSGTRGPEQTRQSG